MASSGAGAEYPGPAGRWRPVLSPQGGGWPPAVAQTTRPPKALAATMMPGPEAAGARPGVHGLPLKKLRGGPLPPWSPALLQPLEIPRATGLRHQSATPTRLQSVLGVAVRGRAGRPCALIAQAPGSRNGSVRTYAVKSLSRVL